MVRLLVGLLVLASVFTFALYSQRAGAAGRARRRIRRHPAAGTIPATAPMTPIAATTLITAGS